MTIMTTVLDFRSAIVRIASCLIDVSKPLLGVNE